MPYNKGCKCNRCILGAKAAFAGLAYGSHPITTDPYVPQNPIPLSAVDQQLYNDLMQQLAQTTGAASGYAQTGQIAGTSTNGVPLYYTYTTSHF